MTFAPELSLSEGQLQLSLSLSDLTELIKTIWSWNFILTRFEQENAPDQNLTYFVQIYYRQNETHAETDNKQTDKFILFFL